MTFPARTRRFGRVDVNADAVPALREAAARLVRFAAAIHGRGFTRASDLAHSREAAAAHEAGHVVAYAASGLSPTEARIWRDREARAWLGWTGHDGRPLRIDGATSPAEAVVAARTFLAGWAGEVAVIGGAAVGSAVDEIVLAQAAADRAATALGFSTLATWGAVVVDTFETLRRHRAAFDHVRRELMRTRRLGRERLRTLTVDVTPEPPEAVLARVTSYVTARAPRTPSRVAAELALVEAGLRRLPPVVRQPKE